MATNSRACEQANMTTVGILKCSAGPTHEPSRHGC